MSEDARVDLFVIGAGSGGVRAARIAASHGAVVAVAEEFRVGGTCVIRGCVPKKIYVYASRFADDFNDAEGFGWTRPKTEFDWSRLVAAKEREISRLSAVYEANLAKAGVALYRGRARITGPHHVRLEDGRTFQTRHIVVATGGTPEHQPAVPGLDLAISSDEIFDLPVFPKRLLAVGAGYVALEFASIFTRLGSQVTVAFRGDQILRGFDTDMRTGLAEALTNAGIDLRPGLSVLGIEHRDGALLVRLSDGSDLTVDQVLLATGRRPATRDLGLEHLGVELEQDGSVKVDHFSRSTVPSIHAIGDVTNRVNLTPVAIREGHAVADTLFGGKPTPVSHHAIATAVFTTPEIGTVGLAEHEAIEQLDIVDIYKTSFRPMKATISGHTGRTSMKIIVDGATDRVVGAHVLGTDAGEMAQLLGIAVRMGATKADFDSTMAVHPTAAEEFVTMRTRSARHVRGEPR